MILEQEFLKADLDEVEQVFSKSMEPKLPIFKSAGRWNKIWKRLLMIFSFILFGCSIMLIILERTFSTEIKIYVFVGIICVLLSGIWRRMEKTVEPMNVVKRKYGEPFSVEMKEDALLYKQTEFLYIDIKIVVEYKNFLFLKADRKWLVIKAEKDEKKVILSKINEKNTIYFMQKKEPFNLRELRYSK